MRALFLSLIPFAFLAGLAQAQSTTSGEGTQIQPRIALELFTSQSCYSCPPAERLLSSLSDSPDLLAIEWHVDYWDKLVYGSKGQWKDIYSSPEATERQQLYNQMIRKTSGVYTPQLIVNGSDEVVGSRPKDVSAALSRANSASNIEAKILKSSNNLELNLTAPKLVTVLTMDRRNVVDVTRGENAGKKLVHTNAVLNANYHQLTAGVNQVMLPALTAGQSCAVLVQNSANSPVEFAGYCS